jgi:hypothetical protein
MHQPAPSGAAPTRRTRARPTNSHLLRFSSHLLNLLMIALSIAAAYFMTIQSIKVELAAKAESASVAALDKKLGIVEILLKEGVLNKEEFYRFSNSVDSRLARIEYLVSPSRQETDRDPRHP